MSPISYADVFKIEGECAGETQLGPGELVSSGFNHFPYFEVVAASGEKAWIRNIVTGEDHLVAVARCRRVHKAIPQAA